LPHLEAEVLRNRVFGGCSPVQTQRPARSPSSNYKVKVGGRSKIVVQELSLPR
jgi:hypothetical protein